MGPPAAIALTPASVLVPEGPARRVDSSTFPATLTPRDYPLDVILDFLLRPGRDADGHEAGAAVP
eukprot:10980759-Alexandrium_andersonii.AAC.1